MLRAQHPQVDQEAAVPVFGERGQLIEPGDRDAGGLERLDQRIGEPLRELVERHQARGQIVGRRRRVAADVAEVLSGELDPTGPDVAQALEHGGEDRGRRQAPVPGLAGEMVEQAADPRRFARRRFPVLRAAPRPAG